MSHSIKDDANTVMLRAIAEQARQLANVIDDFVDKYIDKGGRDSTFYATYIDFS